MTDFYANSVLRVRETDHGDGTGTRTVYDDHGQIVSTETIYGLEIPVPPEPSPEERIAELEAVIATLPAPLNRVLPVDPDLSAPRDLRNP